ncbi:uncharacterized protein TNCV_2107401 [Trichonephila clavipes]|nr:uncharacterized protein TNCV_2107401 [Trichonephila clavipes]
MVAKVANLVAKNDAHLALPPSFCQVLIESPLLRNPLQPINPINFEFRYQETIAISSDNDEEYQNDYDDRVTAESENNAHIRKRRAAQWSPDYDLYAQWAEEYYAEYETAELNQEKALLPKGDLLEQIVRVHYFVRGGFAGNRSRASSKHLSPHLPVDGARFLGGQKGFCCTCKLHVWLSGLQRNRPDVDVFEK